MTVQEALPLPGQDRVWSAEEEGPTDALGVPVKESMAKEPLGVRLEVGVGVGLSVGREVTLSAEAVGVHCEEGVGRRWRHGNKGVVGAAVQRTLHTSLSGSAPPFPPGRHSTLL